MTDAERLALILQDRSVPMATPTGEFIPTPPTQSQQQWEAALKPKKLADMLYGGGEAAASILSSPLPYVSGALGYGYGALTGKDPKQTGMEWEQAATLSPKTALGQYYTEQASDKLGALPPVVSGIPTPRLGAGATRYAGQQYGVPMLEKSLTMYEQGKLTPGFNPVSEIYRPNLPKTPDPSVGTRFQSDYIGGLVDKTPFDLSTKKGASILISPWDSSSRNQSISSVSDIYLPENVVTHGGQAFARDIAHVNQNIGGASNLDIAKRLQTRDEIARAENLAAGGTGEILYMPSTMGAGAENFSVMPANLLTGIIDKSNAPKAAINDLDQSIRDFKIFTGVGEKRVMTQPFKDFKGIMTEEGRNQLVTGEGLKSTAGELRKAFTDRMYMVGNQKAFGFNAEDVARSILDPDLTDVPKGYIGNTVIQGTEGGMKLLPPTSPSYNTNTSGKYVGTLGGNFPIETLMPDVYNFAAQRHMGKKANLRNMAIGDLEKSNRNVAQIIDDRVIANYQKRLADLLKTGDKY